MQGICAAPKGLPLRNCFINSIWETPPILNPVSREYPAPRNTGSKSVALRVYRDPRMPRLLLPSRFDDCSGLYAMGYIPLVGQSRE